MNRALTLLVAALLCAVLSACAGEVNLLDENKLRDTSLLTGEPCEAPCWNGITPGETRYRDAKLIIESDSRFKIADEPDPQDGDPSRIFDFAEGDNPACCQLYSRDGETVTSFLLQTAPDVAYGPVFDRFGEPDYLSGQQVSEEQGYFALLYRETPLVIYVFVENPGSGALSVNSPIIGAMYLAEPEMEQVLVCASLHEWRGFIDFTSYMESDFEFVGEGVGDEELCPTQ